MRKDRFLRRKAIHLTGGVICIILYLLGKLISTGTLPILIVASSLLLLYLLYIFLGIRWKFFEEFLRKTVKRGRLDRDAVLYGIGVISSCILFPEEIAMLSILIVSLSDPISALVGRVVFKTRDKSLRGSLIFFLTSFGISIFFLKIEWAFLVSTISTGVEALSRKFENLLIPIVTGFVALLCKV